MSLKLLNTLTRQKDDFLPLEAGRVKMYACGPTVYNSAHIGNLRSFVMADLLHRALTAQGLEVLWVMNITDIDDKTIRAVKKERGVKATVADLKDFTGKLTKQFRLDLEAIGVAESEITFVNITDIIPEIQAFIIKLVEKGYAYHTEDGSTYFSIERYQADFGDYGALVGPGFLEGKKVGARVKVDEYEKENLSDFALWKAWDNDDAEIAWDHPILGRGRPGWHIECSVVNHEAFPNGTDIHTGGVDLVFPHHTNEIAQSQPLQKVFVRHWQHGEYLQVDAKKMAKSAGNFFTLRDVETKGYTGCALRYFYLQAHYRQQLNFTWEALAAGASAYRNLIERVAQLFSETPPESEVSENTKSEHIKQFEEALQDDLNMPQALASTWELLKDPTMTMPAKLADIETMDKVLGLDLIESARALKARPVPAEVVKLVELRESARTQEEWQEADRLRTEIESLGWLVHDSTEGPTVTPRL